MTVQDHGAVNQLRHTRQEQNQHQEDRKARGCAICYGDDRDDEIKRPYRRFNALHHNIADRSKLVPCGKDNFDDVQNDCESGQGQADCSADAIEYVSDCVQVGYPWRYVVCTYFTTVTAASLTLASTSTLKSSSCSTTQSAKADAPTNIKAMIS